MMPSGYPGVDSVCLQFVEQIHTFGLTPTYQNMTVNFQRTVGERKIHRFLTAGELDRSMAAPAGQAARFRLWGILWGGAPA